MVSKKLRKDGKGKKRKSFNYGMRGTVKGINFNCDSEILVFEEIREKSEQRNPKIWLHTKNARRNRSCIFWTGTATE